MNNVIRTTRCAPLAEHLWVVLACLVLLGLLAWGNQVDTTALQADEAFEAGRELGRAEMAQAVGDAYALGVRDAQAQQHAAPQVTAQVQP